MKNEPLVYIILLNYNGYLDSIDCINSLQRINYNNYKIIIVDNDSKDNSENILKKYINENSLDIEVLQTYQNLGFSGGNNIGIKYAIQNGAEYICLLNNDTVVEKDFLNVLIDEIEMDKDIGIVAGKIMYYDNKELIWSAGGYIYDSRGYHYGLKEIDDGKTYELKKEVSFLTGCLQLIRKDVFVNVGLYEEEYFLYMEDVDFCYRVRDNGYKLMYIPQSKIYHKISSSTGGENSPTTVYYENRNRLLFNKKLKLNVYKNLKFYTKYICSVIIRVPFRKSYYLKYIYYAILDHIKGRYGYRKI